MASNELATNNVVGGSVASTTAGNGALVGLLTYPNDTETNPVLIEASGGVSVPATSSVALNICDEDSGTVIGTVTPNNGSAVPMVFPFHVRARYPGRAGGADKTFSLRAFTATGTASTVQAIAAAPTLLEALSI